MSDLTDRCEQQAEMILCHGFKATHNLLLDCAAEIKRLSEALDNIADGYIPGIDYDSTGERLSSLMSGYARNVLEEGE
jgi:hypothetical protein